MESGLKWRTQRKRNAEGMSPYPSLSLPTSGSLLFFLLTFLCVYESRSPFNPVLIIVKASLFWEWVLCPPPNLWVNVYISRAYSHKNRPSKMTNIASSTTLPTPSTVPKFIVKTVLGKLYHTSITWLVACRIVLPSWWYMIFEIQVKTISKKQCHNCLCNPQKRNSFKLQFNKMWKHQRDHDQIEWRRMSTIIERTKL